jgi:uncharacterized protein (DUF3084 family)
MMKNTSRYLVPIVLGAVGLAVVALVCLRGCERGPSPEEEAAAKAAALEARKVEFKEKMDERQQRRMEIKRVRDTITDQMKKMVDAMREKMPGASNDEVLAALEKEQEWRSLRRRIVDLETASADNRRRTAAVVREYKDVSAPEPEEK